MDKIKIEYLRVYDDKNIDYGKGKNDGYEYSEEAINNLKEYCLENKCRAVYVLNRGIAFDYVFIDGENFIRMAVNCSYKNKPSVHKFMELFNETE